MPTHINAIANEFDSYLQDRAKRLGYSVCFPSPDEACALSAAARLALVEFRTALVDGHAIDGAMRDEHDRGHFVAWAEEAGALVQMNVYRKEMGGAGSEEAGASRIGVRTFAEEFFGNEDGRSLALDAFKTYLGWLGRHCAGTDGNASVLALVARVPDERRLALVRLPSVAAAQRWLQRNA